MAEPAAKPTNVERWMEWFKNDHSPAGLAEQLAEDVVFLSPVVHTPQQGKMITMAYLLAAGETIGNDTFEYVRVFDCGERAVLEFETQMNGFYVNGVDMIEWNADGKITDFKVMIRPLKAVQTVHAEMAKMLEKLKAAHAG